MHFSTSLKGLSAKKNVETPYNPQEIRAQASTAIYNYYANKSPLLSPFSSFLQLIGIQLPAVRGVQRTKKKERKNVVAHIIDDVISNFPVLRTTRRAGA